MRVFAGSCSQAAKSVETPSAMPKIFCWDGLRKSQSARKTDFPSCASATAIFAATVDFPSFSETLVTISTLRSSASMANRTRVASIR